MYKVQTWDKIAKTWKTVLSFATSGEAKEFRDYLEAKGKKVRIAII